MHANLPRSPAHERKAAFLMWLITTERASAHMTSEPSHSHADAIARALIDAGSAFFVAIPLAALAAMTLRPKLGTHGALAATALLSALGLWGYLTILRPHESYTWIALGLCLAAWPILIIRALNKPGQQNKKGAPLV